MPSPYSCELLPPAFEALASSLPAIKKLRLYSTYTLSAADMASLQHLTKLELGQAVKLPERFSLPDLKVLSGDVTLPAQALEVSAAVGGALWCACEGWREADGRGGGGKVGTRGAGLACPCGVCVTSPPDDV